MPNSDNVVEARDEKFEPHDSIYIVTSEVDYFTCSCDGWQCSTIELHTSTEIIDSFRDHLRKEWGC